MSVDRSTVIAALGPDAEMVVSGTDGLVVRAGGRFAVIEDMGSTELEGILAAVDGRRSVAEIIEALSDKYDQQRVLRVLSSLGDPSVSSGPQQTPFKPAHTGTSKQAIEAPVTIIGNGRLASAIVECLGSRGFQTIQRIEVGSRGGDSRFREAVAARLTRRHTEVASDGDGERTWSVEQLVSEFRRVKLVICALEGSFFRSVLDVNAAGVTAGIPVLFVTVEGDSGRCQ